MKLTEATVKSAAVPKRGRKHFWDDELTGFGLRVYPSGSRSFVFRYTTPDGSRRRLVVVGEWGALTTAQARQEAKRLRGRVLDGRDPAGEREARKAVSILKDFSKTYVRRMEKRWKEKTRYEYQRRIDRHLLPALGSRRLDSITRAQVTNLLEKVAEKSGPTESNRLHELIRAMFNRAQAWGFFPEDRPNPALHIERFKERSRERWLKPEEVERLMGAVRKQPDPFFRAFVPLLLLTGMRKSELLRAKWEEVDLDRGEILLPTTKSGRPQTRKLSTPAVQVLRFLPRELVDGPEGGEPVPHPYVFPSRGTKLSHGDHRRDFKREWNEVREAAGLEEVTLHDLRRTAGSYMAQAGVPLQVIGEVLGHQHPSITKVYARLAAENERDALETLGEKLGGLLRLGEAEGAS